MRRSSAFQLGGPAPRQEMAIPNLCHRGCWEVADGTLRAAPCKWYLSIFPAEFRRQFVGSRAVAKAPDGACSTKQVPMADGPVNPNKESHGRP
jgi:hypothetical protein